MGKYKIYYGLGGGFGGARCFEEEGYDIVEFENEEKATDYAYELACEEYQRYEGSYGLRDIGQIMEEDEVDEEIAEEIYEEEMSNWLDYYVKEIEE